MEEDRPMDTVKVVAAVIVTVTAEKPVWIVAIGRGVEVTPAIGEERVMVSKRQMSKSPK